MSGGEERHHRRWTILTLGFGHKAPRASVGHPRLRTEGEQKGERIPRELERLLQLLERGLAETAALWPPIQMCYSWVHRAAHILANEGARGVEQLRREYRKLLYKMSSRK